MRGGDKVRFGLGGIDCVDWSSGMAFNEARYFMSACIWIGLQLSMMG